MSDKPGKIDWKTRLEAMKHGPAVKPGQSVAIPPEPPAQAPLTRESVPPDPPEPELDQVQEVKPEPPVVKPIEVPRQPPISLPDPKAARMAKLERQIRSLKVMALVAAFLALIAVLGLAFMILRGPGRVLQMSLESLTITDTKGMGRAWIGERDGQVQVELRDQTGKRRLGLGLDAEGEPRLTFYHKDQKILGELVPLPDGQPGIRILNQAGEAVKAIPAPSPPIPNLPPPAAPDQALAPLPPPIPQPAVVPSETPKAEQKAAAKPEAAVKAAQPVIFVANPGGKSYHLPSSPWVKNTPPNQLLKFSSAAEAEKAGFHPGRDCRPDLKH
ncbi:MAG: hypothetical protein ACYC6G_02425 [Desulfobaccales bacterium]